MSAFAVALIGRDRPGIVAAAAGAMRELGCNLEDVTTTILRGHFAMVLVVETPAEVTAELLHERLAGATRHLDLRLAAWPVELGDTEFAATHVLTVYGKDQVGIVHEVATALSARGVNIADMTCRLHDQAEPTYLLTLELALPPGESEQGLRDALDARLEPMGLDFNLNPLDEPDIL